MYDVRSVCEELLGMPPDDRVLLGQGYDSSGYVRILAVDKLML